MAGMDQLSIAHTAAIQTTSNGGGTIVVIDGTLAIATIGPAANGSLGTPLIATLLAGDSVTDVSDLIDAIQYTEIAAVPTYGTRVIAVGLTDAAGNNSATNVMVTIESAPVITAGHTTTIGFGSSGVVDALAGVTDYGDVWNTGSLKVQISAGADATHDSLSLPSVSNAGIWLNGTNLMYGPTTQIGTASASGVTGATAWTFNFSVNATAAAVQALADAITIAVASGGAGGPRTVTYTATDHYGAVGTGTDTVNVAYPPIVSGGSQLTVTDSLPFPTSPLGGIQVIESTIEPVIIRVALNAGLGSFTNATSGGWTGSTVGGVTTYSQQFATGAAAFTGLNNLTFQPTAHLGAVGSTQTIVFTVTATGATTGLTSAPDTSASETVTYTNTAPSLGAVSSSAVYFIGGNPVAFDLTLLVTDPDDNGIGNWNGGTLEAAFSSVSDPLHDTLVVTATGPGGITLGATTPNTILYAGTVIGTIDPILNGAPGEPLEIRLNAAATGAAVQALGRALSFNINGTNTSEGFRYIKVTATDGGGLSSASGDTTVTVNLPPSIDSFDSTPRSNVISGAASVTYDLIFTDPVTGVTPASFNVTTTGSATGTVDTISGSGTAYTVILDGVSGDGSLTIAPTATSGIIGATSAPVSLNGFGVGSYIIDHTPPVIAELAGDSSVFAAGGLFTPVSIATPTQTAPSPIVTEANLAFGGTLEVAFTGGEAAGDSLFVMPNAAISLAGATYTIAGATVVVTAVEYDGATIATIAGNTTGTGTGTSLIATLYYGDTPAEVAALIQAIDFDTSAPLVTGTRNLAVTLADAAGNVSAASPVSVLVELPPVVTTAGAAALSRGGSAVALDPGITITTADGDWSQGTLAVAISAHAVGATLTLPTVSNAGIWLDGTTVMFGTNAIGTASAGSVTGATDWIFALNGGATDTTVSALADALQISVDATGDPRNPPVVALTVTDSHGVAGIGSEAVSFLQPAAVSGGGPVQITGALVATAPLAGMAVTDGDAEGLTVSVAFAAGLGDFGAPSGWSVGTVAGIETYTQDFSGTATADAGLASLLFQPTSYGGQVGSSPSVAFTVEATGDTTGVAAIPDTAASLSFTYPDTTPFFAASGDPAAVAEPGGYAVAIDPDIAVDDPDNQGLGNWGGGTFDVAILASPDPTIDALVIGGDVLLNRDITVAGNLVAYEGISFGVIVPGHAGLPGTDLDISLLTHATTEAVEALAQAINFTDNGVVTSSLASRHIQYTLTDGAGHSPAPVSEVVQFAPAPTVSAIVPTGIAAVTNATTVSFAVTFSDGVRSVTAANFSLSTTGSATGVISAVTPFTLTSAIGGVPQWIVTVSQVAGDGTIGLDLSSTAGIIDTKGALLSAVFSGTQPVIIDNTAPVIAGLTGDSDLAVAGAAPIAIDQTATVTEANIAQGGTLAVTIANDQPGEDLLSILSAPGASTAAGITTSGSLVDDGATTIGTIVASGGSLVVELATGDTTAEVADLIHAVSYQDSSATPVLTPRTVDFVLIDAAGNAGTASTATIAVEQPPAITGGGMNLITGTLAPLAPFASDAVTDEPGEGLTVTVAFNTGLGNFTNATGWTSSTAAGVETYSQDFAGVAAANAGLAALVFQPAQYPGPLAAGPVVTFTVGATGDTTGLVAVPDTAASVAFAYPDTTPVLTAGGGAAAVAEAGGGSVAIDPGLLVSDADNAGAGYWDGGTLDVAIAGSPEPSADILSFPNELYPESLVVVNGVPIGTIVADHNGQAGTDLLVVFDAFATDASVQDLAQEIQYRDTDYQGSLADRSIQFTLSDAAGNAATVPETVDISPGPSVSAIVPTGTQAVTNATSISFDVTFSTVVRNVTAANFSLATTGSASGVISAVTSGVVGTNLVAVGNMTWTVTVSEVAGDGSIGLDLTSTANIRDGHDVPLAAGLAGTQPVTIDNTAPVIAGLTGDSDLFVAGGAPITIDHAATVTEANIAAGGTLAVSLANAQPGEDVLSLATTAGGITASGSLVADAGVAIGTIIASGGSLVVALAAGDTVGEVADLIHAVAYQDSSATPVDTPRIVDFLLTDAAGNAAPASTATIVVDQPPVVTAGHSVAITRTLPAPLDPALGVSDPGGNWAGGSLTVQITGNADATHDSLTLPGAANAGISLSGTMLMFGTTQIGTASAATATGGAVWTFSFNGAVTSAAVLALADAVQITVSVGGSLATRTVSVSASDGDGVTSRAASDNVTVIADDAPTIALLAASDSGVSASDGITDDATPIFTGTAYPGQGITVFANGVALGVTTAAADGSWQFTPASGLADGVYAITATNSAGRSTQSAASVVIDTMAPAATLLGTVDALGLTGTAEAGSTVTFFNGTQPVGTAATGADGTWHFAPGSLPAGSYSLTADVSDAAGNVSAMSGALALLVNADSSYALTFPAAGGGTTVDDYTPANALTQSSSVDAKGNTTQVLGTGSAIENIYDANGNLIGTIVVADSSTSLAPSGFATDGDAGGALTQTPAGIASIITLLSEDNVISVAGADTINGGGGSDTISANGFAVLMNAGAGQLTFYGGAAASTVLGGSGTATILGGTGGGTYYGGAAGGNLLAALGGTTVLVAGGPGDLLFGGGGSDTLFGSAAGGSVMIGGSGAEVLVSQSTVTTSDQMWAGTNGSMLTAGAGNDILGTGAGATLVGGAGNDVFVGAAGPSTVFGGTGNDVVFTGSGAMNLVEGSGTNTVVFQSGAASVTGGTGPDIYAVISGLAGGSDTITDFKPGQDKLELFGANPANVQQNSSGGSTQLVFPDGTTIELTGVASLPPNAIL